MGIQSVEIVSIPVSDQAKSKAFYMQKLGFHLDVEAPFSEGQTWIQLSPRPGVQTAITLVDWFEDMPPGSVHGLVLGTDDIEASHREFTNNGVIIEAIIDTPWGKFAGFHDLDGNGWTLHQGT